MADFEVGEEDYGLEEVGGSGGDDDDEEDDLANDDTFGDVPTTREGLGGDFDFNNEGMARLHEEFLAAGGDGGGGDGGGFFGDAQDGGQDFTLEAGLDAGMQDAGMVQGLDMDLGFLDDPAPPQAAPSSPSDKRNGLRVAGLPPNLDEVQVKQVLSHFGPLASFSLQRGAGANVALLSYQDPAVAKEAATSLNGVPLGGNATLDVQLIDLAPALFAAAAAAAAAFSCAAVFASASAFFSDHSRAPDRCLVRLSLPRCSCPRFPVTQSGNEFGWGLRAPRRPARTSLSW